MLKVMITKAFLAKATSVLVGLSLATGGAAAADALPQVAQDKVAAALEKVTALEVPDSSDAADAEKAEKAQEPGEKPAGPETGGDTTEETDKADKPEKPKDNFGSWVSTQARSGEKGTDFGQRVSAEAHVRAAARHEAKPGDHTEGEDEDKAEAQSGSSKARGHRPPQTPPAQSNRGSGNRP